MHISSYSLVQHSVMMSYKSHMTRSDVGTKEKHWRKVVQVLAVCFWSNTTSTNVRLIAESGLFTRGSLASELHEPPASPHAATAANAASVSGFSVSRRYRHSSL